MLEVASDWNTKLQSSVTLPTYSAENKLWVWVSKGELVTDFKHLMRACYAILRQKFSFYNKFGIYFGKMFTAIKVSPHPLSHTYAVQQVVVVQNTKH